MRTPLKLQNEYVVLTADGYVFADCHTKGDAALIVEAVNGHAAPTTPSAQSVELVEIRRIARHLAELCQIHGAPELNGVAWQVSSALDNFDIAALERRAQEAEAEARFNREGKINWEEHARAGWAAHEAASKREDMALTEVAKLKDDLEAERVDSVLAEAERNAAVALVRQVAMFPMPGFHASCYAAHYECRRFVENGK